MTLQDRAAIALQQINERRIRLTGTYPQERKALLCLKTAIEGMMNAHAMLLKHDWDACELTSALTALLDQWKAKL